MWGQATEKRDMGSQKARFHCWLEGRRPQKGGGGQSHPQGNREEGPRDRDRSWMGASQVSGPLGSEAEGGVMGEKSPMPSMVLS